jgi:uncharacterized RDD family membrane protein YckC
MTEDSNETARRAFGEGPAAPPSAPPLAPQAPTARDEGTLAAWGTRAAAFTLDGLFLFGFAFAITLAVVAFVGDDDRRTVERLVYAIVIPLYLLYAPLLMARTGKANGQTFGKQMMDIRVVRTNGEQVTFLNAFLRQALAQQLLTAITLVYAPFDYLWPLRDPRNQALHDKIASTLVVHAEAPGLPQPPATAPATTPPPSARRVDEAPVRDWLPPSGG